MSFDKQQAFLNQNIKYKFCNEKNFNNIEYLSWKMLRRTHVAIDGMENISRKCPYALTSTPQNISTLLASVYLAGQKLNHEWNLKLIQGWGGFSSTVSVLIHVIEFYQCPKRFCKVY